MHKPTNARLYICYKCLLFLTPTCFGHSCDHLQDLLQYKYQDYDSYHIKYIIEFFKILSIIKVA
jgi:hypothetical protein